MASGPDFPDPVSFLERLFSSRDGENLSRFLPFMLSLSNPQNPANPDENSNNNSDEIVRERFVFINPFTQTMLVIESSNRDRGSSNSNDDSAFESWLNDLFFRKEGQPPASKASMDAMPEIEIGGKGLECVICLEEMEVGEKGKEMPCKHQFHGGCIEKWLKIHGTCPVCRYKMPVEERDDRNEKSEENQSESGGRSRGGVWMGFGFGDNQSELSTESSANDDGSTYENELD